MMMMMMDSVLRSVLQHAKGLIDDLYLSYSRYVFSTEVDAQDGMALGCQAVREVLTQGYSPWPCKLSTVTAWCAGAGTSLLSESWDVARGELPTPRAASVCLASQVKILLREQLTDRTSYKTSWVPRVRALAPTPTSTQRIRSSSQGSHSKGHTKSRDLCTISQWLRSHSYSSYGCTALYARRVSTSTCTAQDSLCLYFNQTWSVARHTMLQSSELPSHTHSHLPLRRRTD